jgi:hypothetical protein
LPVEFVAARKNELIKRSVLIAFEAIESLLEKYGGVNIS